MLSDGATYTDRHRHKYLPTFILRGLTRLHIEFS
jgi:hypothetical protein